MDTKESNQQNQDEIDLVAIFRFIYQSFVNFYIRVWNIILLLLISLKRFISNRKFFLIVGIIAGALIGFIVSRSVPPVYETSLTVESQFLKGYDFISEIEKLNDYFKEGNYEIISMVFNSKSVDDVKAIKGISAETYSSHYNIFDKYGEIDKLDSLRAAEEINSSLFIIKLNLNENKVIVSKIENWIINYLNSNKVLNKNYEIEKNYLLRTKSKLVAELENIDTLKKGINKKILSDNTLLSPSKLEISVTDEKDLIKNPIKIYETDLELFRRLQEIEKRLSLLEKISIINGVKSIKENKIDYLKGNVFSGALWGLLIVCFSES